MRVTHRREPHPLYDMLRHMGYRWLTTCRAIGRYEILIWPRDRPPPAHRE